MSARRGFRGTWILFAMVAALAGYTYWEYRKAAVPDQDTAEEKKLFNIKTAEVDEIKLTRPGGTIDVVRDGSDWKVKQPIEDAADSASVEGFIFTIAVHKGKVFRSEEEVKSTKWSDFGFEPPALTIEITDNKKPQTIDVGTKNAFDGSFYIRKDGELLLTDPGVASAVNRDANSFRSRKLWREGDAEVSSAEVVLEKEKYGLKKDGDKWTMQPAPKFTIDNHRVERWLRNVQALSPADIASESLSEEDKRSDLLLKPSLTIKLDFKRADGAKGEWALTAGQDKAEDLYLFTNQRPTVYKTRNAALAEVRVPAAYFRDGKAPFHFDLEQAAEVEIINGAFKHKFKKDGGNWKLAEDDKNELVADKLVTFFQNLSDLESTDFMPAGQAKGFKSQAQVAVKDGKGLTLLALSWGDEYKTKQPYNKGMTFRYIKTNLEKEAMGVPTAKITSLMDTSMVKAKAEEKKGGK
jgi:hypothetical protein